jgi:hypothetical protein
MIFEILKEYWKCGIMIDINWRNVGIAVILLTITEMILMTAMDLSGFCMGSAESELNDFGVRCLVDSMDLVQLSPLAIMMFFIGFLIVPIIGCFVGALFYFRSQPVKTLKDAAIFLAILAVGAVIITWIVSIGQHMLFDTEPFFDPIFFEDPVLSVIVLIFAFAVVTLIELVLYLFCAAIGGGIAYLISKPK